MNELIPVQRYTRAAERALATLRASPWIVAVPMAALGVGTLTDWLLAPLLNLGLILAAPVKAAVWSAALYVWQRALLEGKADRAEVEAELAARARNLSMLAVPLLFGTLAFLTLAWGGALAFAFVLAVVLTPLLEASLLGTKSGLSAFFTRHGRAWAVTHLVATAVLVAVWLVAVMVAAVFHVLAGEVVSALVGGPLLSMLWLVRGHAYLALDAPAPVAPPPPPRKVAAPAPKRAAPVKKPGPK